MTPIAEPRIIQRHCGGWLAVAPKGASLRIGTTGDSSDEARDNYDQAVMAWDVTLGRRSRVRGMVRGDIYYGVAAEGLKRAVALHKANTAQVDRSAKRQDPQGLDRNDESAVAKQCAQPLVITNERLG